MEKPKQHERKSTLFLGEAMIELLSPILPTYPIIAEQTATFPFAVYRRAAQSFGDTKDVFNHVETANFEVVIADSGYSRGVALAARVKETLEHRRGWVAGFPVASITVTTANEDWAADAYVQRLNIIVEIDTSVWHCRGDIAE